MTEDTMDTDNGIQVNPELVLTILQTRGETDRLLAEQIRSAFLEAALATVTAPTPNKEENIE